MIVASRSIWSSRRKLVALALSCTIGYSLYQHWRFVYDANRYGNRYPVLPALSEEGFPKKIWYKLGAHGLSDDAQNWTASCIKLNPSWNATFLTDSSADDWVQKAYAATRPDIVEIFLNINVPILKADFLRYLLLYAEGGMWSDLDVSCESPIDEWIPPQYANKTSLLVGWEFDVGYGENVIHQLNSWMIIAKPKLPYMMMVIDDIVENFHEVANKNNIPIANITKIMVGDVVDFCGPRRFTRSVFKSLQQTLNMTEAEFRPREQSVYFLEAPAMLEDILILPGYSFAKSMIPAEETVAVGPSLVVHHYAGTWKNELGGEESGEDGGKDGGGDG